MLLTSLTAGSGNCPPSKLAVGTAHSTAADRELGRLPSRTDKSSRMAGQRDLVGLVWVRQRYSTKKADCHDQTNRAWFMLNRVHGMFLT
jgi:hypothetical protein